MQHPTSTSDSDGAHLRHASVGASAGRRDGKANPWARKPLWVIEDASEVAVYTSVSSYGSSDTHVVDSTHHHDTCIPKSLPRHLTVWNLVSIGVGGTIGSGIFVVCGLIAREYAGPATCLSWAIAGVTALLSGCCYAELASHLPTEGSAYAYAYASMGELPAFLAAACVSLEFLVSGAAVARSWGDKVVEWLQFNLHAGSWVRTLLVPGLGVNPMACIISIASTFLLLSGVEESKWATAFFTWVKVGLVLVMTIGGFFFFQSSNLQPLVPPEFGVMGVMRGATSSFFGFVGYDGMCCVAGEAIHPKVSLPRAVLITLATVTVLYVTASISLTGMQHYSEISTTSGFSLAFHRNSIEWLAQLVAFGEIFTLPIVVFISELLQPRLQYALARDGLLPKSLAEVDEKGVLRRSTIVDGIIMTTVATFVPFTYLDDFISSGILLSFSITDTSLILMRMESPTSSPFLLEQLLLAFNVLSFTTCLAISHGLHFFVGRGFLLLSSSATLMVIRCIYTRCVYSSSFGAAFGGVDGKSSFRPLGGGAGEHGGEEVAGVPTSSAASPSGFQTPLVPFLPLLAIFANWYLVSQLEMLGIFILVVYLLVTMQFYFCYGARHSVWGHGRDEAIVAATASLPSDETAGVGEYNQRAPYSDVVDGGAPRTKDFQFHRCKKTLHTT